MEDQAPSHPPVAPPLGVTLETFTLAYLADHEAECPACGYNVHALTQARCPECGRPVAVRVVTASNGFSISWIITLITFGLAAGVGLLVAVVLAVERNTPDSPFIPVIIYFLCNIPMPLIVLLLRRFFVRISLALQIMLAMGSVLLMCAMFAWFVMLIRR